MKIFIVPAWYPSELSPESGTFFRDRAQMLKKYGNEITVIVDLVHSFKDLFRFGKFRTVRFAPEKVGGVIEYRQETPNWFPKLPRITNHFYKRRLIRLFEKAVADRGRPDVVIAHSSLFAGAALGQWLMDRNIPLIVVEHLKEFLTPGAFIFFQKNCIRAAYRHADRIVATSTRLCESIMHQFPEFTAKTVIVPNPVDITAFTIAPDQKPIVKSFVFLAVALFRPEKRLDLLLRAFASVLKSHPDTRLILVGDGPEWQRIERLISDLNLQSTVILVGYRSKPETAAAMQSAHALVLSSEVETFGVVLIEAIATGLPVIATQCGGPEDIVTPETGFLVPVNDIAALASAMHRMIVEYGQFDPQCIRQIAIEKFGDHGYWQAIRNLYLQIINEKPTTK